MSIVFYSEEFNDHDLANHKASLEKFNEIIKDLKENNSTSQGNIKLIKGDGNIKYFRAKLSDSDRLLFTSIKHNNKDAFVILEVILNHGYHNSKFLTNREKIKNIEIISEEVSDTVEIEDTPQVSYFGKFITFNVKQEDIVERVRNLELPLVINGAAGSGKTSVALESLKKIKGKFEGGKILYITKSENLIKESKKLLEYEYYDETADEFKIAAPEEIDFLSLHKFLEKRAEDIKGKKPIDRSKFFSWFNEICKKDKFKKYKKDGDKIFEEFTAVIGGGGLLGEDGKDRYTELGNRQAIFSEEKRDHIYGFFKEYREFIDKDSEYYDPNLVAHECIAEEMYDAVVVDEVQDLTESTLYLVLKSLKGENKSNFLLCGDVNQVIHPSFFSLSKLKSFLHKNTADKELSVCTLEKNYRNSEQVIEIANRVLHLKNYCFASEDKITTNEEKTFFMTSDTKNTGNVSFVAKNKEREIAEKVSDSINWAILVLDDESKQDAGKLFGTPLVFNIHEAKGLEFENVILYKFTSHETYNKIWNIAYSGAGNGEIKNAIKEIRDLYNAKNVRTSRSKNKEDKSFEEYKFYINAFYVGVSRAISSVYIMDDESNFLKVIKPERVGNVDIEKEESAHEGWRDIALKLIDEGNVEQAKDIAEKLLCGGKGEYAKEIMSALKAKEKDYTQESQLPLDKNEQAISELKTENVTQESSISQSTTSAEKSRKRKEKKSERLEKNTKELFSVLENGDLQKVKELIKKGVDVNAKDGRGYAHLYVAAYNGHGSIVQLLLDRGADVNVKNFKGYTPLHMSAYNGHGSIVQLLLDRGADVNAKNFKGYTPLHSVVNNGHDLVVRLLLDRGADVNANSDEDYIPLHIAVKNGYDSIVQLLLDRGADINAKNFEGTTSLCIAVENGHGSIVQLLLDRGADVNANSDEDYIPLHIAVKNGYDSIVQLLLDRGADVNAKNFEGTTSLCIAVENGHGSIVQLLLDRGADVNAKNFEGTTPLCIAVENGHSSIVQLLLNKGAMVNAESDSGGTSLHYAARYKVYSILQRLLDRKANDHSDKNLVSVPELLLQYKANVNAKDHKGNTPLSLALAYNYSEMVNLLLSDQNINVGCVKIESALCESEKEKEEFLQDLAQNHELLDQIEKAAEEVDQNKLDELTIADQNINVGYVKIQSVLCEGTKEREKFLQKLAQDRELLDKVKKAAEEEDESKLDELLKDIKDSLKSENRYGFKPSLNYSLDGSDENTTIETAIKAGGKLLQLLYDYAKKNIGTDNEIFKRLKQAKEQQENSQPKSSLNDVSCNLAQAQTSIT